VSVPVVSPATFAPLLGSTARLHRPRSPREEPDISPAPFASPWPLGRHSGCPPQRQGKKTAAAGTVWFPATGPTASRFLLRPPAPRPAPPRSGRRTPTSSSELAYPEPPLAPLPASLA